MAVVFSTPLTKLPDFVSVAKFYGRTKVDIVHSLQRAERPSPAFYNTVRDIITSILEGKLTYDDGLREGGRLSNENEKRCTLSVLLAAADFLQKEEKSEVIRIEDVMLKYGPIEREIKLSVAPIWLRRLEPNRLLALHLWEEPLTPIQLSVAAALLEAGLRQCKSSLERLDLDFVCINRKSGSPGRQLVRYSRRTLKNLEERELIKFLDFLSEAWVDYKNLTPRGFNRRAEKDLFSNL